MPRIMYLHTCPRSGERQDTVRNYQRLMPPGSDVVVTMENLNKALAHFRRAVPL